MLYQTRQKITSLDIIEFLGTHVSINNEIDKVMELQNFCENIAISDTLIGSFLDILFLLLSLLL